MLYTFIKCLVRLGLLLYCRKIVFTRRELLKEKGPLLLACNHPNSFFDAILLGAFFKKPVHFLARGDAFKNPVTAKILKALKLIPIYRLKEGKEYLALNDATFERCTRILEEGGIVLIFSEGLCQNLWQLRPLKKGTARIAINTWKHADMIPQFKILPVAFNYNTFSGFGKKVIISFGEPIFYNDLSKEKNEAEQIVTLNKLLYERLEKETLIEEGNADIIQFLLTNLQIIKNQIHNAITLLKAKQPLLLSSDYTFIFRLGKNKRIPFSDTDLLRDFLLLIILFIPALAGLVIHLPLYLPLNNFLKKKTQDTVFYHSALFVALLITYPIYILLISVLLIVLVKKLIFVLLILIIPLLALLYLVWNDSFESISNYFKLSGKEILKLRQLLR